jgi:hypothetical protein
MRIVDAIFVVAVLEYARVGEQLAAHPKPDELPTIIIAATAFLAAFDVLLTFYFKRKRLQPAVEKLRLDPLDPSALKQWRGATVLILALSMSVGLYGLALRSLGAGRLISWPFYVMSLILMFIWWPQLDLAGKVTIKGIAQ